LGALATGPEDIDRTAGAGAHGSIDIAFPDSSAVADVHGRSTAFLLLRLTRNKKIRGIRNWVKGL
jgi:hypothetical protein